MLEELDVEVGFREQDERWGSEDTVEISERSLWWDGRMIDPWMGHNAQKLVDAGPRQRPGFGALGRFSQELESRGVVGAVGDLSVDEHVGVEGSHLVNRRPLCRRAVCDRAGRRQAVAALPIL